MIVGQGNDPVKAAGKYENTVRMVIGLVNTAITTAESLQVARGVFDTLTLNIPGAIRHYSNASKCEKSRYIIRNYVSEYGKLLGNCANDSFITEDSQQYSLDRLGGKVISRKYPNGVATCSSTHFEEPSHKEIWGEGGHASYDKNSSDESKRQRLKHGSIKGGILGVFFEAQKWTIYNESGKEIQL